MTSVVSLISGAGPEAKNGLKGQGLMRRPAQHHRIHAAPGWAHPYTGLPGIAVFYNDGGTGNQPAVPAAPSPADIAARGQQQPAPAPTGAQPLIDRETGVAMTQDRFNKIMTRQFEKSRGAAFRELAESLGIPYEPDTFDPESFKATLKEGQEARQQVLTDEQRRNEDMTKREQAIAAREEAARAREEAAAARDRNSLLQASLVRLGAVDSQDQPNLQDALAMLERDLRETPNADDTAISEAAAKLKERRPGLFGGQTAPQSLPPAPSSAPAGGNQPHQPVPGNRDAVKEAARKMAIERGLRRDDAA